MLKLLGVLIADGSKLNYYEHQVNAKTKLTKNGATGAQALL